MPNQNWNISGLENPKEKVNTYKFGKLMSQDIFCLLIAKPKDEVCFFCFKRKIQVNPHNLF